MSADVVEQWIAAIDDYEEGVIPAPPVDELADWLREGGELDERQSLALLDVIAGLQAKVARLEVSAERPAPVDLPRGMDPTRPLALDDTTMWSLEGRGWLSYLEAIIEEREPSTVLHEFRPPSVADLPDLATDVAEVVWEWLYESDVLATDDGDAPELDRPAFADAIRAALAAALADHVDLSQAAWQPTGRVMTVGEARAALGEQSEATR